jgi:hypothetical protein
MCDQDNEVLVIFSKFKKGRFFKNSNLKNTLNGLCNKTKKKNKIPLDPRMKLSTREAKIMNSFVDFSKF